MPIFNPPDNFSYITYVDSDFTFTATTAPSSLNTGADKFIVDEIDVSSYVLSQFVFDNPSVGLTSMEFELKKYDGNFNSGVFNDPFLFDQGSDGIAGWGWCNFQNGQNSTATEGTVILKKVSGIWYIQCDVTSGDYDRVTIELNYQSMPSS